MIQNALKNFKAFLVKKDIQSLMMIQKHNKRSVKIPMPIPALNKQLSMTTLQVKGLTTS
jgi:hypothetical protein